MKRLPREITAIDECPNCGTKVSRKYVFMPSPDMYWFLTIAHRKTEEREKAEASFGEIYAMWQSVTTADPYQLTLGTIATARQAEKEAYANLGRWVAEQLQKP